SALLLTVPFAIHAHSMIAAFTGLVLALAMAFLFTIWVSLIASTLGALAFDRQRKVLFGLVLIVGCGAIAREGLNVLDLGPWGVLERVEHSAVVRVMTSPFLPCVRAFTAPRLWSDLVVWAAAGGLIDTALVGLILLQSDRSHAAMAAAS